jgi:CheY-like chemotaxis protein/chemotaxis signal transduction protein
VSLPRLLLVDDSQSILAFEREVLSGRYALTTASNGLEALEKLRRSRPDAVLLDLSMPEMNGEEVLSRIKADPELVGLPVIIISSEHRRGEDCLKNGAAAFLPKPIQSAALQEIVARVLDQARSQFRKGSLSILPIGIGPLELAIPLSAVRTVVAQPAMRPLAVGPSYLAGYFDLHGEPVCVLDLARRLGVAHSEPIEDRKLVVLDHEVVRVALGVDRVRDPEEIPQSDLTALDDRADGGASARAQGKDTLLDGALVALARSSTGLVPVLHPLALLSRGLLRRLPVILKQLAEPQHGDAAPT